MSASSSAPPGHHRPPPACTPAISIYGVPPPDSPPDESPDEPPPSYHDAIHAESSPLLVGPPPDYGAFRAYLDSDHSSQTTTEADQADAGRCPEWAGHAFVLLVFLSIIYGFWTIVIAPDSRPDFPG